MPITAALLRDEIIALFSDPTWLWVPGQSNYDWLDATCTGFFNMWTTGVLTVGTCVGPGPTPHTHIVATLVSATMSGPPKGLGLTVIANAFSDVIAAQVSAFLISNTVLSVLPVPPDACIPHTHLFASFGVAATLAANIVLAATGIGAAGPAIPIWADAFATGLLSHLTANAALDIVTHPVQHTLS